MEEGAFLLLFLPFYVFPYSVQSNMPVKMIYQNQEEKKMTETKTDKKNSKTIWIACAALLVLIAAFALIWHFTAPKPVQGAKTLSIEVVNDKEETVNYEVHTDAEFLKQAMEEAEGLTFEGTESEYGLMVETVNGLTADYSRDGSYWAFYVNGEYCQFGIDSQPVNDGETYSIVYTVD